MASDLLSVLVDELEKLFEPVTEVVQNPELLPRLVAQIGAESDTAGGDALAAALSAVATLADDARRLAANPSPSFDDIAGVLAAVGRAFDAMRALSHAGGPAQQLESFGVDLADFLVASYLIRWHPLARQIGALLTLIELEETQDLRPPVLVGDHLVRGAYRIDRFHLDRISDLLEDPVGTLRAAYATPLLTVADANAMAALLFPRVRGVLRELGVPCRYGFRPGDEPLLGDAAPIVDHALIVWAADKLMGATDEVGVVFTLSPAERGDLGLLASPFGALQVQTEVGPWAVELDVTAQIEGVAYGRHGTTLLASPGTSEMDATFTATLTAPDKGPAFVLGSPTGSRLEVGGSIISAQTALGEARRSLALSAAVSKAAVFIMPGDGDGFLRQVLPADGLHAEFDLGIAWSNSAGLTLHGAAGLEATVPVGLSLGGISLTTLTLGIRAGDDQLTAEVSGSLAAVIGPVQASIDRIGLRGALAFTDGNLGPADLDIGFKPPSGLSLTVDAGPVTGGGALLFDPDRGLYAGEMQLQFEQIAVRAVGLLTTDRSGYSLLVLVSAEFPPVQLGLGFMLVAVGGLLGIHRTVAVEALRAGLKAGALGAVLSPPDPKANPAQLVASLAGLFPPAAGRYVFAPTARIVWGSPTLITIDLALVLELPSPVRLVALGRIRALLPEERDPVVRLQVDVLGVIDFDQQAAAVDATLIDSRIAQFALTGDLALRMSWGRTSVFLLAVGGFHPRFAAPPGFPALGRVAVALASGDNPKLRLEAYLALTSNTVQFGARVDVGARAGSFSIGGFMAFDALVTLSPLAFVVDIAAKLAVKAGSHTLLSISLALTLSGPRPWHAHGRASFSILFFDISFGFDVTIGDPTPAALPSPVDVAPLLLAALADPRAWTAQLPAGADVVTLRTLEPGQAVLAHPLATLRVRQRVAPLDRTLDRFGAGVPAGARRFRITLATIGGVRTTLTPLQDSFAPAQFTAMSDDEKLSAPSFEAMTSGAALGADGYSTGTPVTVSLAYEQALVTAEGIAPPAQQRLPLPLDVFATVTATTSAPPPAFAIRDAA